MSRSQQAGAAAACRAGVSCLTGSAECEVCSLPGRPQRLASGPAGPGEHTTAAREERRCGKVSR